MKFGDNLKKLRKSQKLSQEELAERVQVSRQSVSKWETGEAYPTMNNILELCQIFHCQINDLVNDSIIDLNSLDEEVRQNVVKFKKEQQSKMKVLSRVITIIARIGKILCLVAVPFVVIAMIISGLVISKVKVEQNEIVFENDSLVAIAETPDQLTLKFHDFVIADVTDQDEITKPKDFLRDHSKFLIIIYIETGLAFLILSLVLVSILLRALENLFENIYHGDTPFTLENVKYIKKMAYLLIIVTLLPNLMGVVFELILKMDLDIGFELFSLVEILFLFSIAYIFQYGYEIQLDSKGKMYGNTNE